MDLVEIIAEKLHRGWIQCMQAAGVVYGPKCTPITHPHLVPWRDLDDIEAQIQSRFQASRVLHSWLDGEITEHGLPAAIHNVWVLCEQIHRTGYSHALPYEQVHAAEGPKEHAIQAESIWPPLPVVIGTPYSVERALQRVGKATDMVVASGCFDLLHIGHVRHLKAARNLGGALVVLLSDDASVTALKGPGRPIIPAAQRAEVLEAIGVVDGVVVHRQCELLAVIKALGAAVFAKGADTGAFPYEKEIAELGCRIERVCEGETPHVHTRDIVERCRNRQLATEP